eukprot:1161891-Pelagomonas_calceolata.AAC.3
MLVVCLSNESVFWSGIGVVDHGDGGLRFGWAWMLVVCLSNESVFWLGIGVVDHGDGGLCFGWAWMLVVCLSNESVFWSGIGVGIMVTEEGLHESSHLQCVCRRGCMRAHLAEGSHESSHLQRLCRSGDIGAHICSVCAGVLEQQPAAAAAGADIAGSRSCLGLDSGVAADAAGAGVGAAAGHAATADVARPRKVQQLRTGLSYKKDI